MLDLPWPPSVEEISEVLGDLDKNVLNGSVDFIKRQSAKPMMDMVGGSTKTVPLDGPESYWLNVLTLFNANQQLNEACNKVWAARELQNATRKGVWKKTYRPVGGQFGPAFLSGTLIPTLYYSQISGMISILSSFGCVPFLEHGTPFLLVRTENGWKVFPRRVYLKGLTGNKVKGWHDQIIEMYFGLLDKGIRLPKLSKNRVVRLKGMRNELHYQILSDLKMWRPFSGKYDYSRIFPAVDQTIVSAINVLNAVKCVSTGCDQRYFTMRDSVGR